MPNELVRMLHGQALTTSLIMADALDISHADVLRAIKRVHIGCEEFQPRKYLDLNRRERICYTLTLTGFIYLQLVPIHTPLAQQFRKEFHHMLGVIEGAEAEAIQRRAGKASRKVNIKRNCCPTN